MRWRGFDWRAAFVRWQPYGSLVLVALLGLKFPHLALVVLAVIHWSTLDALRTRRPIQIDLGIASQAASIEDKYRFCGDGVIITNRQVYRIGSRHYLVEVTRTKHDLEGRELA